MKYSSRQQILDELTDSELRSMSKSDLNKLWYKVVPDANLRMQREIRRVEKGGTESFALRGIMETRGENPLFRTETSGMTSQQMQNEIREAVEYLNTKTSTLKGWNEFRESTADRFGMSNRAFGQISKDKNFWKGFNKMKEEYSNLDSSVVMKIYGESAQEKDFRNMTESEQVSFMRKRLNDYYERTQADEEDDYLDEFFS